MNKTHRLKEKFLPGLKYALFSNFRNATEAILELVDNAVSNRILGQKLAVDIILYSASKGVKKLSIINKGGYGLTLNGLSEFLQWGKIKERSLYDIGRYGQGGKAALGYLGRTMKVAASPKGKYTQYLIEDYDLHKHDNFKEYDAIEMPIKEDYGFVAVEVGELTRKINEDKLKESLVEIYRPLLERNEIEIKFNGKTLRLQKFPLDTTFNREIFNFSVSNTINNKKTKINGWIGRLAPKSGLKGGMRCYFLGRLVCDKEFFEHPDAHHKQTLNFLFGEVFIDTVPVTTNKTDFDRDSMQWQEVQEKMFIILKPHVDELLGREIKEPTEEEKNRVQKAKDIVAYLMKLRKKELDGLKGIAGEMIGQKVPDYKGRHYTSLLPKTKRGKYEPRTPPPAGAIGKRKRTKGFMDWELRPIEEATRSIIEERGGKHILVINNLYPGYKAMKGNDLYLIETAALQLAKPEEEGPLLPSEYLNEFDELFAFFCDNLDAAKTALEEKKRN